MRLPAELLAAHDAPSITIFISVRDCSSAERRGQIYFADSIFINYAAVYMT